MPITDEVQRTLSEFPQATENPAELERLREFLQQARRAGIELLRRYDLPPLDTIGRGPSLLRQVR